MSISKEDKKELVKYWLEKSEESIASAKSEIREGRLSFAAGPRQSHNRC